MSIGYTKTKNGVTLVPQNTNAPSVAGDLRYNSSTDKLEVYNGALDPIVTEDSAATLSNKTLDNTTSETIIDVNLVIQSTTDQTKQMKFDAGTITTGTTRTYSVPDKSGELLVSGTLSNQIIDNTNTITVKDANLTIQDNSDITKQAKFELSSLPTATTASFTVPSASTTLVGIDSTQTLSNKTLDNSTVATVTDSNLTVQDNADHTKQLKFEVSPVPTATTVTLSVPSASTTLVGIDSVQSLTNKTITDPLTFAQNATPGASPSSKNELYFKNDNHIYSMDSTGTERQVDAGAASNPLTSVGDMVVGGASGIQSRLPGGNLNQTLTYDPNTTNNVKWGNKAYILSTGSGIVNITATGGVQFGNLNITTGGGPVLIGIIADQNNPGTASMGFTNTNATSSGLITLNRNGSNISSLALTNTAAAGTTFSRPPPGFFFIDTPPAGVNNYIVNGRISSSLNPGSISISNVQLVAYEL